MSPILSLVLYYMRQIRLFQAKKMVRQLILFYFFGTDKIVLKGGRENEGHKGSVEKVQQVEVTPIYIYETNGF